MKNLTYKQQIILGIVCIVLGLLCADFFGHWAFASLGIVISGLLFVINPVHPAGATHPRIKLIMRITGAIIIVLGLITRHHNL